MSAAANNVPTTKQPLLIGERVQLVPVREDAVPLYQRWLNDLAMQRTLGGVPAPYTLEQEQRRYHDLLAAPDSLQLMITLRQTGQPIGIIELQEIDQRNGTATLVIFIGEAAQRGAGYGTAAIRLILDYGFTALGLQSVGLTVVAFHVAAVRAYERAGFRICGRRRACRLVAGQLWDDLLMEVLATDLRANQEGAEG